jgi:hypothetical protein
MENNNNDGKVVISRFIYDNLIARDVISTFRGIYMDKINEGTMVLDKKIIELISAVEEVYL